MLQPNVVKKTFPTLILRCQVKSCSQQAKSAFHNCHLIRPSIPYLLYWNVFAFNRNLILAFPCKVLAGVCQRSLLSHSFDTTGIWSSRLRHCTLLLSSSFCSVAFSVSLKLSLPPSPHDTSESTVWLCGCR